MKTPITYYGGKQTLAPKIIAAIPQHWIYCEPFVGGAAVFFAKEKSAIEVLNDKNRLVTNFYKQVKENYPALNELIQSTMLSRAAHQDAYVMHQSPHLFTDLQLAWAFWVLTQQGFCGSISETWSYSAQKPSKYIANKKDAFVEAYAERLKYVQLECDDALRVIKTRDKVDTFFYIDPPYFNSDMGHYGDYNARDFEDLLSLLSQLQGKFLLSSYPSELLTKYTEQNGWHTQSIELTIATSSKGKKKTEVLTANYTI